MKKRLLGMFVFWLLFSFTFAFARALKLDASAAASAIVESVLILAVLLALACMRPLWETFTKLSLPRRVLAGALFAALLYGQSASKPRGAYPFTSWGMFTSASPSTAYIELELVHESGRRELFPFSKINPVTSTFLNRFTSPAMQLSVDRTVESEEIAGQRASLTAELYKLVEQYKRRFPDAALASLDVVRCTIPIHEYEGRHSIQRETVLRLESL